MSRSTLPRIRRKTAALIPRGLFFRRRDMAAVAIGAVASGVGIVVLDEVPVLPVVFGLVLVSLPGYALTSAVFAPERVRGAEGLLLGAGLSIGVVILTGFLMNELGIRLERLSWAIGLTIVTLAAVTMTLRRASTAAEHATPRPRQTWRAFSSADRIALGIAVMLSITALGLARAGADQQPTEPFSAVWLLPGPGSSQFQIGIRNEESASTSYRLVLRSPAGTIRMWPAIDLRAGQEWQADVPLQGDSTYLELLLYRAQEPGVVYRRATWGAAPTPVLPSGVERGAP